MNSLPDRHFEQVAEEGPLAVVMVSVLYTCVSMLSNELSPPRDV